MALKKKNGELSTELKDLDVDRVDGVDRPATGRAFLLFKSESAPLSADMQKIVAAIQRIAKADPYEAIIAAACDQCICKMLDGKDNLVGYVVKGSDMTSPLMKFDEAVALVRKAIRADIAVSGNRVSRRAPQAPQRSDAPRGSRGAPRDCSACPRASKVMPPARRAARAETTALPAALARVYDVLAGRCASVSAASGITPPGSPARIQSISRR